MNGTDLTSLVATFHQLGLDKFLPVLFLVHTIASALDAAIPQPAVGSHWTPIRKIVSFLALNVGNATNANNPALVVWMQRVVLLLASVVPEPTSTTFGEQADAPFDPQKPPAAHP
jgi:hypothetical protein